MLTRKIMSSFFLVKAEEGLCRRAGWTRYIDISRWFGSINTEECTVWRL